MDYKQIEKVVQGIRERFQGRLRRTDKDTVCYNDFEKDGSKTSGNWGHKGRPGEVGGSAPGGGHDWLIENRDTFRTKDGVDHATRWLKTGKKITCKGPKDAKKYLEGKKIDPDAAKKYGNIRRELMEFDKAHPDLVNGTFDVNTHDDAKLKRGFSVTFHQNNKEDDPFGGYDDETYAQMISDAKEELDSKVYFGNYGNPEVSFCTEDIDVAMEYAVQHNQESIWDNKAGRGYINPFYKPEYNPIKQDDFED